MNTLLTSLQAKVTLVFLVVALLPLGVVGIVSLRTADAAIQEIVTRQIEDAVAQKQDLLERWIAERRADVEVVAGSAAVRSLDPAQVAPYLDLVRRQYRVYERFVVADARGAAVLDSSEAPSRVHAEDPWFVSALASGSFMSPVQRDPSSGSAVFLLASSIGGPDGRAAGAVCATVTTREILSRVLRVGLGQTGECYLVDGAGRFLAHREPARILTETIARSGSFARIFSGTRSGPVYTDYRGIPVLGASRPVAGTGWHLVVEQDRDEAFARSYRLRSQILFSVGLTVALAAVLAVVLALYVTRPVRKLSEAAMVLAGGRFADALATTSTTRRDEIGALYGAFRHMASRLRDRHESLEEQVDTSRERLREADARLQRTIQAAARSEHLAALGRLASGVAHEIRTPLASLKLYLQSAEGDLQPGDERHEDLQVALRQIQRLEATVNHFLDFARPREPALANLDFATLIEDVLAVARPRARQQSVEVEVRIAPGLPTVRGDLPQLSMAVVNLVVNALEAMPSGGKLGLAVELDPESPADDRRPMVRIDVADTGPGIPAEHMDRLFEPFFTTKASGSGLGLPTVVATLQGHGGVVRVHSDPGKGTTFSLYLPLASIA